MRGLGTGGSGNKTPFKPEKYEVVLPLPHTER